MRTKICSVCTKETSDFVRGKCRDCLNEYRREYYKKNRQRILDLQKNQNTDIEKLKARKRAYYLKNREKLLAYQKERQKNNPRTEYYRNREKTEKQKAYRQGRYKLRKDRTPKWADVKQIQNIYLASRKMGREFEVDHIVPLRGKLVSGLHTPDNLRIISKELNNSINNKWYPDCFHSVHRSKSVRLIKPIRF